MGTTRPNPPTLAETEQQREDLLTQADLPSQPATSPAAPDPASPPISAPPNPDPLPGPPPQPPLPQQQAPVPEHSLHPVFEQYALYVLAGEAVRTLIPHTEARPEAILLQLLAAFGNILGPGALPLPRR